MVGSVEQEEERGVTYNILPCDLVQEILSRLDAKSLMRVKCVCKSWLSLLRYTEFINLHLKRQQPCIAVKHSGFIDDPQLQGGNIFSFHSLEEKFDRISSHKFPNCTWNLMLVGSHNGVICLICWLSHSIHLWNPFIKVVKTLPSSPPAPPSWMYTSSVHGFGYDPLTNDFKVVKVSGYRQINHDCLNLFQRCNHVGVYSLRSNSWKTMKMPDIFSELDSDHSSSSDLTTHEMGGCSVFVNGSIHWELIFKRQVLKGPSKNLERSFGIVAFDLSTEVFKLINSPPFIKGFYVQSIFELSGCLSFVTIDKPGLIEIWVMKKYGVPDSWTKHLSVNFTMHPQRSQISRLLGFLNNGNMVFDSFVGEPFSQYDPKSNKLEYLGPGTEVLQFTNYVESIFLN